MIQCILKSNSTGDLQLFGDLLSNLRWLLSSVHNEAVYALLGLYRNSEYKNKVPEQVH